MTLNDWNLQQTRIISGLGIIRPDLGVTARAHRYFIKVIRFPTRDFFNGKWNPQRSEYAKISYVSDDYVWREDVLRYPKQVLTVPLVQTEAYLNPYLQCQFAWLQENLALLMAGVVPPVTPTLPPSLEISALQQPVTEIRFACRADTAIQVQEYIILVDQQCAQAVFEQKQQNSPDMEEPVVPPGTPLDTTPPYFPPNDDGNTVPFEEDNPPGNTGTWSFTFKGNASSTIFSDSTPGFDNDNPGILIEPDGSCLDGNVYSIYSITRGVRYYPDNLRLSTCGSGAMEILTQNFVPD